MLLTSKYIYLSSCRHFTSLYLAVGIVILPSQHGHIVNVLTKGHVEEFKLVAALQDPKNTQ